MIQGDADAYGTLAQVAAVAEGCAGPTERLILPGIGHAPHHEDAERVGDAAASFVQKTLKSRDFAAPGGRV